MQARGDVLLFDPVLPPDLAQLGFSVHYRGHRVDIMLTSDHMSVSCRREGPAPIKIGVGTDLCELAGGEKAEFQLDRAPREPQA
jgi:trehalose/maltose hydrolase-like predicted phosphorylase